MWLLANTISQTISSCLNWWYLARISCSVSKPYAGSQTMYSVPWLLTRIVFSIHNGLPSCAWDTYFPYSRFFSMTDRASTRLGGLHRRRWEPIMSSECSVSPSVRRFCVSLSLPLPLIISRHVFLWALISLFYCCSLFCNTWHFVKVSHKLSLKGAA